VWCVLDTNHYVALASGGAMSARLKQRAAEQDADLVITVITPQEITQGWLAELNRENAGPDQIYAYQRFLHSLLGFSKLKIFPFDGDAARQFVSLQQQRTRIGTMDLKIAAICIAHDAMLLTRNLVDFEKVPGLRVENWLD
jgi:tRNA(fMet)-specific endonuclease VapC